MAVPPTSTTPALLWACASFALSKTYQGRPGLQVCPISPHIRRVSMYAPGAALKVPLHPVRSPRLDTLNLSSMRCGTQLGKAFTSVFVASFLLWRANILAAYGCAYKKLYANEVAGTQSRNRGSLFVAVLFRSHMTLKLP